MGHKLRFDHPVAGHLWWGCLVLKGRNTPVSKVYYWWCVPKFTSLPCLRYSPHATLNIKANLMCIPSFGTMDSFVMILHSCPWFSLVLRQNHDRPVFYVQTHGLLLGHVLVLSRSLAPPPCYPRFVIIAPPVSLINLSLFNPLVFAVLCRFIVWNNPWVTCWKSCLERRVWSCLSC